MQKYPEGYDWTVVEHRKMGDYEFNASRIGLYQSRKQQGNSYLYGNELREELKDKNVLNANVLDFLLDNPYLIPEEWKGKNVFFWGTIFKDRDGRCCVSCMYWDGLSAWRRDYRYFSNNAFDAEYPAAVV